MVDITPLIAADRQVIKSYSKLGFKVSGTLYQGAAVVFPDRTVPWKIDSVYDLKTEDFSIFKKDEIDILLMGCGNKAERMELPVIQTLKARGILLETMDTGAACRTYNVLMADGRRIAAALFPMDDPS
jgi:uncharacterized protein